MSSGHPQAEKSPDLSVEAFVFALHIFTVRATIHCRQETCRWHVLGKEKEPSRSLTLLCLRYLFSQLGQLSSCRRKCPVDTCRQHLKIKIYEEAPHNVWSSLCLRYLFSQPVTRQLSSAYGGLTSVFGMGTGGPTRQSTQTHCWKRFSPSYIQPIYVDFCY